MFRSFLSSFVRSFGWSMGRAAARRMGWLAIPVLILTAVIGVIELLSGGELSRLALPIVPPSILPLLGVK